MSAPRNQVLRGDALQHLRCLPDASVDMVLTSPPYFRLRNYDVAGQLGLEDSVDEWVQSLRTVCDEARRVLVPTGTLWLNLGDTYATHPAQGAAPKSLLLAPERVAATLLRDGWIIRNKLVWAKTNPMPTSARDRLACTYEVIYVLTTQPRYFFDLDAIREPHRSRASRRPLVARRTPETWRGPNGGSASGLARLKAAGQVGHPLGKNPGDVWRLATSSSRTGHHATFPTALAARAIAAGCPEARCRDCRAPWTRPTRRVIRALGHLATRAALAPTCVCGAGSEPCLVLDPFIGSGTTAIAAEQLNRDWLGIELNPDFATSAERRISHARQPVARAGPTADDGAAA